MKKYNVSVNGTMYEVEIELASEQDVKLTANAPVAPAAKAAPPETPAQAAPRSGTAVSAPMPGTILSVNVAEGDTVKAGQVLFILEAMKMENEIMASSDGKISSVNVQKGASCETGTVLCTIA